MGPTEPRRRFAGEPLLCSKGLLQSRRHAVRPIPPQTQASRCGATETAIVKRVAPRHNSCAREPILSSQGLLRGGTFGSRWPGRAWRSCSTLASFRARCAGLHAWHTVITVETLRPLHVYIKGERRIECVYVSPCQRMLVYMDTYSCVYTHAPCSPRCRASPRDPEW
jgi:hypothetical protein